MAKKDTDTDKYFTITDAMVALGLSSSELLVYGLMLSFTSRGKQFTGSLQYIGERTGMSVDTASRCVRSLSDKGIITISRAHGKNNEYSVLNPPQIATTRKMLLPASCGSNYPQNAGTTTRKLPPNNKRDIKDINKEISLSRAREVAAMWNEAMPMTKTIDTHMEAFPERLIKTQHILDTYGMERVKLAIRTVSTNKWLTENATYDWAICDPYKFERILGGYYAKRTRPSLVEQRERITADPEGGHDDI